MRKSEQDRELIEKRQSICRDFYRSFDRAQVDTQLGRLPKGGIELGEGRHFRSFRLSSNSSIDLAINIAKPAFGQGDPSFRREWQQRMRLVQTLTHPLLPPFELVGDTDLLAYVLPYCEASLPPEDWDVYQVRPELRTFEETLAQKGLVLDDYWQLRLCCQHPFVIDFSELKRTGTTTSRLGNNLHEFR